MQLHIRKDQERNDVREGYIMKAFVETNWHLANIFKDGVHIYTHTQMSLHEITLNYYR